jgi:23S rRNA (cytosine1962-C5)-methyltransferase
MTNSSPAAPLRLKKQEERRLRAGHLWIYSNEVDATATPLGQFAPGQAVVIEAHNGKPLGSGYVNPHSLICARLVSRDPAQHLDRSLLVHRLNVALSLRERLFAAPFYRLVYGEADGLPGLVVDRYGDVLVAQFTTAGMELARDAVLAALDKVLKPRAVLLRNDGSTRELEGLTSYVEAIGEVPETITLEEHGVRFQVPLQGGQKTGWFFDQRPNRARLADYVQGRRVLDVFSYVGAWGVQAAVRGASEVICVDASQPALELAQAAARDNGVADRFAVLAGDAFEVLRGLREQRERFDVVVVDPPAFIKRRKDSKAGEQAYHRINQLAMQLLQRDGILISSSCSHHLSMDGLQKLLLQSARHLDRDMQLLERGHQGPDHPVHPAIPETEYLKTLFCRVLPSC